MTPLPSVCFVSDKNQASEKPGGVQWCTREYLATLAATGLDVRKVLYSNERTLRTKVLSRIFPVPYKGFHSPGLLEEISGALDNEPSPLILLNNTGTAALAPEIRRRHPHARIFFLSHGAEITDMVNNLRIAPSSLPNTQHNPSWIGKLIKKEIEIREALNGVVCISEEDVFFERWLGATDVIYLPRQVSSSTYLSRQPVDKRIGVVATLNHGPNLHGLELLLSELNPEVEIRLVGGPRETGEALASKYQSVSYLGPLGDAELEEEASTWLAFANPIFCQARGASTKVATALGWGLPILTTPIGARGYRWDENHLPLSSTPAELADMCLQLVSGFHEERWFDRAETVAKLAPSLEQSAIRLAGFLKIPVTRGVEDLPALSKCKSA